MTRTDSKQAEPVLNLDALKPAGWHARKLEERKRQLAKEGRCPQCEQPADTAAPSCVLHQLIQLVRNERTTATVPARELLRIHVNCNVSALWLDLADIIYRLGEGDYSNIRSS